MGFVWEVQAAQLTQRPSLRQQPLTAIEESR